MWRHPQAARFVPTAWLEDLGARKARNAAGLQQRLPDDFSPMKFYNALRAVRHVLCERPDVYVVNEGANALDITRNVVDIQRPGHRLDSGTGGGHGNRMGYAIAAAVETVDPVVLISGDSAFGFSGIGGGDDLPLRLPITVLVLINGGVYRGDEHAPAARSARVPFLSVTSIGTISSLNVPSATARTAFSWLAAANASCSSRLMS